MNGSTVNKSDLNWTVFFVAFLECGRRQWSGEVVLVEGGVVLMENEGAREFFPRFSTGGLRRNSMGSRGQKKEREREEKKTENST